MIKQNEAQILGRKGERWFESILPREWLYQKPNEDIGIDGRVIIGTSASTGGIEFNVQVKASKNWQIKNGLIPFRKLKRETLLYLCSHLVPTLFVLFDDSLNSGYYCWALDLFEDSNKVIFNKNKTITVNIPAMNILTPSGWNIIADKATKRYEQLSKSLSSINIIESMLPVISSLSHGLQILQLCEFAEKPNDDYQLHAMLLTEVVAHKEIIKTLNSLRDRFDRMNVPIKGIQNAIADYTKELSKFIKDIDLLVNSDNPIALYVNEEKMNKLRPKLLWMLTNMICSFSNNPPNNYDDRYDYRKHFVAISKFERDS